MGSQMCGVAFMGFDEMGRSGKMGLGKYLGAPRYDLSHYSRVLGKCVYFEALMGACGVKDMWDYLLGIFTVLVAILRLTFLFFL